MRCIKCIDENIEVGDARELKTEIFRGNREQSEQPFGQNYEAKGFLRTRKKLWTVKILIRQLSPLLEFNLINEKSKLMKGQSLKRKNVKTLKLVEL